MFIHIDCIKGNTCGRGRVYVSFYYKNHCAQQTETRLLTEPLLPD